MDIITLQPQALAEIRPNLEDLIETFLADQDISESSRETYSRSLKQFTSWIYQSGRDRRPNLQREDILAFKDFLAVKRVVIQLLFI